METCPRSLIREYVAIHIHDSKSPAFAVYRKNSTRPSVIVYYLVYTDRQARFGLRLEGQRELVRFGADRGTLNHARLAMSVWPFPQSDCHQPIYPNQIRKK